MSAALMAGDALGNAGAGRQSRLRGVAGHGGAGVLVPDAGHRIAESGQRGIAGRLAPEHPETVAASLLLLVVTNPAPNPLLIDRVHLGLDCGDLRQQLGGGIAIGDRPFLADDVDAISPQAR